MESGEPVDVVLVAVAATTATLLVLHELYGAALAAGCSYAAAWWLLRPARVRHHPYR